MKQYCSYTKNAVAVVILAIASTGLKAQGSFEIEEIVVTASKRGAADIQDVAGNISALGSETLDSTGVLGIKDFQKYIPGLNSYQFSPGNTRLVLRGLSSEAGASQVGVYYNEIPALGKVGTNFFQSDLHLVDLERIEVLRGPQGTLYGAGSQGGTIRYITRMPNLERLELSARVDLSARAEDAGEEYNYSGMINVPLVEDVLGLRAVFYRRDTDGNVDMPQLGFENVGDMETYGGRITARWDIGDNTTLTALASYQEMDSEDAGAVQTDGNFRTSRVLQPAHDELEMYNLTLEHEFGIGSLTATTSYVERKAFYSFDVSQFFAPPFGPGFPASVNQDGIADLFSAEVRFASALPGPFQFIIGGFYQDRDVQEGGLGKGFFGDPTTGLPWPPDGPLGPRRQFYGESQTEEFSNKAVFGEVSWQLTSKLELLAGIRYFEIDSEIQSEQVINPFGPPAGLGPVLDASHNDQVFKFQATYALAGDILMYLAYSEGFREGGPNALGLLSLGGLPVPTSYAPDKVENYELGWKTQFMDRQLTLNGSLYYMKWDDIQVVLTEINGAFPYVENSGKAELYGVEAEVRFQPDALEGFTLSLNLAYASQELDEDSPGYLLGDMSAGRKGDDIPDATDFTLGVIAEQRFTLLGRDAFVSFDASYTGESLDEFSTRSPLARELGNYWLAGARLGIEGDNWSASIYAKNIFNEREPIAWIVYEVPGLPDQLFVTAPRAVGLRLSFSY